MAAILATVTNKALFYYPTASPGSPELVSFAIGRGGWVNPGSGNVARSPDPSLEDLDIIQNPGRYASITANVSAGNIYFVQKSFITEDFSILTPPFNPPLTPPVGAIVQQIRCILDFTDFNDIQGVPSTPPAGLTLNPSGTSPQLWELGVFAAAPMGYTNPTSDPSSPLYQGRPNQLMVFYATFNAETKNNTLQLENDVWIAFPT